MANCVSTIAGNIGLDCENPIEGGYTGRAVLVPMEAVPVLTRDASNPRIVNDVALSNGSLQHVVAVDNEGVTPFDGSSTTGNNDAGFIKFVKVVSVRMPERGANFAAEVLEPLVKSGRGFIGIFEKVDRKGDGSFELIGGNSPLKVIDPATVTRQETANGGAWVANLQSSEIYSECVLFDTDYETTLTKFEALLALAF